MDARQILATAWTAESGPFTRIGSTVISIMAALIIHYYTLYILTGFSAAKDCKNCIMYGVHTYAMFLQCSLFFPLREPRPTFKRPDSWTSYYHAAGSW